jgi:hypothetical protein
MEGSGGEPVKRKRPNQAVESSGPRAAFLPDPDEGPAHANDDLAEELAEEFLTAATTDEDVAEELQDEVTPDELGGPFVTTTAREEFAKGTDPSNPKDADAEPLPRVLSES